MKPAIPFNPGLSTENKCCRNNLLAPVEPRLHTTDLHSLDHSYLGSPRLIAKTYLDQPVPFKQAGTKGFSPFPSHLVHGVPMVPSNSSVYKGLQGWFASIPYCSPEASHLHRSHRAPVLRPVHRKPRTQRSRWFRRSPGATWQISRAIHLGKHVEKPPFSGVESLALKVNQSYFLGQTLYDLT